MLLSRCVVELGVTTASVVAAIAGVNDVDVEIVVDDDDGVERLSKLNWLLVSTSLLIGESPKLAW